MWRRICFTKISEVVSLNKSNNKKIHFEQKFVLGPFTHKFWNISSLIDPLPSICLIVGVDYTLVDKLGKSKGLF
jgi:hypothetical protein